MRFKTYFLKESSIGKKLLTVGLIAYMAMSSPLLAKNNNTLLYQQLARHEGVRKVMYKDSLGIATVGIGFNVTTPENRRILAKHGITNQHLARGLTEQQVRVLFEESLKQAKVDAKKFLPNLEQHPVNVQNAMIDMAFNLGLTRLMKFTRMRAALFKKDYNAAANEMLSSLWAKQVGNRSTFLANLVRSSR